jgi:hypothetical protein
MLDLDMGATKPEARPQTFEGELEALINQYSIENESDTPDFILVAYIRGALTTFTEAVRHRDKWYGFNTFNTRKTDINTDEEADDCANPLPK